MLVECMEDQYHDWSMCAVSGDNDDDNSLVRSGSLSPDWEWNGSIGVWMTQTGKVMYRRKMEELVRELLLQMKQVLQGPLWEELQPISGL